MAYQSFLQSSAGTEVKIRGACFHRALVHGDRRINEKVQWVRRTTAKIQPGNEECSEPAREGRQEGPLRGAGGSA